MNPGFKKDRAAKHVSRACLACRSRHLKCDGLEPICKRCLKANRECNYVKSNRGGSRKKGISTKTHPKGEPDSFMLPCVRNGLPELEHSPDCNHQCMASDNYGKMPPCLSGTEMPGKEIDMNPTFNSSNDESLLKVFDPAAEASSLDKCYISPGLIHDLDVRSIVNTYYNFFQSAHPFLPETQDDAVTYLESIPYNYDLLLAMKIIGDGQSSGVYARDVETINFLVRTIIKYIQQVGKDLISLQSLLMLAMVTHISSLHDLSMTLRETVVSLVFELRLNQFDQNLVPEVFIDVNGYITQRQDDVHGDTHTMVTPSDSDTKDDVLTEIMTHPRVANIPKAILADTIRRTLWEVYFFDTISGTASGNSMSRIATRKMLTLYPSTVLPKQFDYKSRAEACKLVNDSIQLNVAIQNNKDVNTHLIHMKAAIGNWELKLENPDMYNAPYLVNADGHINEGVFEAIMLVNYAKIFTHRPFSYLWRSDISKHPKCTDEEGVTDNCAPLKKQDVDSRKIIETRKTIDSASSVVRALIDTDPAKVTKRTPFFACALAFSCLVHLSAYSWVESSLQVLGNMNDTIASLRESINEEELQTYAEYIKLELGAIYQISRHWALSAKLIQHIKDTLKRVSPVLYQKVQIGVPDSLPQAVKLDSGAKYLSKESVIVSTPSLTSTSVTSSTQPRTGSPMMQDIIPADEKSVEFGNSEFNSTDLDIMMEGLGGVSPNSDTGCDWVDKHIFEFDNYNIQKS